MSSISSWMVCDVSRASLVFFGITLMAVHFPGLDASASPALTVPVILSVVIKCSEHIHFNVYCYIKMYYLIWHNMQDECSSSVIV